MIGLELYKFIRDGLRRSQRAEPMEETPESFANREATGSLRTELAHRWEPNDAAEQDEFEWHNHDVGPQARLAIFAAHLAGIASVTNTSLGTTLNWSCGNTQTGVVYSGTSTSGGFAKKLSITTALGNTTTGGGDQFFSFQQGVSAGSTVTLDLTAMTNIMLTASATLVRIKGLQFRVLSASDDPTISPAPTATSIGCISNVVVATPCQIDGSNGGAGLTLTWTNSGGAATNAAIGTAGTGYPPTNWFWVAPATAAGSGAIVSVSTNSGGVPNTATIVTGGSSYTATSGTAVQLVQYMILTGGFHAYSDPNANGFAVVSATQKKIQLINLDPSNAITFECDVLGCST